MKKINLSRITLRSLVVLNFIFLAACGDTKNIDEVTLDLSELDISLLGGANPVGVVTWISEKTDNKVSHPLHKKNDSLFTHLGTIQTEEILRVCTAFITDDLMVMTSARCVSNRKDFNEFEEDNSSKTNQARPNDLKVYFKRTQDEPTKVFKVKKIDQFFRGTQKSTFAEIIALIFTFGLYQPESYLYEKNDWAFLEVQNKNDLAEFGVMPLLREAQDEIDAIENNPKAIAIVAHPPKQESKEIRILSKSFRVHTKEQYDLAKNSKKFQFPKDFYNAKRLIDISGEPIDPLFHGAPVFIQGDSHFRVIGLINSDTPVAGRVYSDLKNKMENKTTQDEIEDLVQVDDPVPQAPQENESPTLSSKNRWIQLWNRWRSPP